MSAISRYLALGGIVLLFFNTPAYEENLSGRDIMDKVFYREDGNDSYFKVKMVLEDKRGSRRERILEIYAKDYGDLRKTFLEFTSPPDIDKTRFLSWENEGKDDTQYLYLPALGKIRRIVSSQKNLRFVNTDFTYEDMQRRRPQKDEHTLLREENYQQYSCFLIESIPHKGTSQYSKRILWVDKNSLVIVKMELYNRKGEKAKEFYVKELEKKSGIWTPLKTIMIDLKDNHNTLMETLKVSYNQSLKDDIFSLHHLEEN